MAAVAYPPGTREKDPPLELVDAAHVTRSGEMIDRLAGALDELADRFAPGG